MTQIPSDSDERLEAVIRRQAAEVLKTRDKQSWERLRLLINNRSAAQVRSMEAKRGLLR